MARHRAPVSTHDALIAVVLAVGFSACGPSPTVDPPAAVAVASVMLSSASISGTGTVQGTVNLTGAAGAGGVTVNLSSSNTNAATVPLSVVASQGATSASFTVTALSVASAITVTITASVGTSSQSANVTVNPPVPSVVTTFVVIPNPGTIATGEQCEVAQETVSGSLVNRLKCTFDASGSSASGGINSYTWTFQIAGGTQQFTGAVRQNLTLPCGNFPGTGATVDRPVILDIVTPNGPGHLERQITFRRNGPC